MFKQCRSNSHKGLSISLKLAISLFKKFCLWSFTTSGPLTKLTDMLIIGPHYVQLTESEFHRMVSWIELVFQHNLQGILSPSLPLCVCVCARAHMHASECVDVDTYMPWCMYRGQRTALGTSSHLLPCLKQGLSTTVYTRLAPGDPPDPTSYSLVEALGSHMLVPWVLGIWTWVLMPQW